MIGRRNYRKVSGWYFIEQFADMNDGFLVRYVLVRSTELRGWVWKNRNKIGNHRGGKYLNREKLRRSMTVGGEVSWTWIET